LIAAAAAWNVNLNSQRNELSAVSLANVETLAAEDTHKYETSKTEEMTILDYDANVYRKISVTVCEGSGSIDC
jgi:hypothetical protein